MQGLYAPETESEVLGQIMLFPKNIEEVITALTPDHFNHPSYSIVYKCYKYLHEKNIPIDLVTVTQALRNNGYLDSIGGPSFIANLTTDVKWDNTISHHIQTLCNKKLQRDFVNIATSALIAAQDPTCDINSVIDQHEKSFTGLSTSVIGDNIVSGQNLHEQMLDRNSKILKLGGIVGIPSGFTEVDRMLGGWQQPDLIILAGRPAMGKTALASQLAINPTLQGTPVAIFSLEMSALQLYIRMQSQYSGISAEQINRHGLNDHMITQLNKDLPGAQIYIDDTPAISVFALRNTLRRIVRKHGIKMCVIDYLQLITGGSEFKGTREQEVSFVARSLKNLAKELGIPIIALSQMSRPYKGTTVTAKSIRPHLSDLRESGEIEQAADIVMFIHRPSYYGFMEDENGHSLSNAAQLIIAKNRSGSTADIPLSFEFSKVKFSDYQKSMFTSKDINTSPGGF